MYSLYTEYTLHNATITMQKGVCAVDRVHGVSAGYDRLPKTIHEYFIWSLLCEQITFTVSHVRQWVLDTHVRRTILHTYLV